MSSEGEGIYAPVHSMLDIAINTSTSSVLQCCHQTNPVLNQPTQAQDRPDFVRPSKSSRANKTGEALRKKSQLDLDLLRVRDRLVPDLVERVRRVRDKLAQEDLSAQSKRVPEISAHNGLRQESPAGPTAMRTRPALIFRLLVCRQSTNTHHTSRAPMEVQRGVSAMRPPCWSRRC